MDVRIRFLSFFVIRTEGDPGGGGSKSFRHYRTLDRESYETSELKPFLDGEFARIVKRKAEKNPNTDQAPTKIGRFLTEPGHELTSNPNYNLFKRLQAADSVEAFHASSDELVRLYADTSAVRGGAMIVVQAELPKHAELPFVFVLKCDFEPKIARISDERGLIAQVEMAISARNMKSIQFPHMPEPGMIEEWELKIHQASHARYFEDFLKFVAYERPLPEIVSEHVIGMVQHYIEEKWRGLEEHVQERQREEEELELWAARDKRDLQEKWSHEQVRDAARQIVQIKEDLPMAFRLDEVTVRGKLSDYGESIHIAKLNGRYVVLIVGDQFQFDHGMSPVELLQPEPFEAVAERLAAGPVRGPEPDDDEAPWD
ncbi:DUF3900 domain-containing protein [Paenibacillus thermoaerophilus]|uniref:DUF3900 domain-containing protein n=1 Tax=Paenibacillus thermoaerophilus TaxID=1215385 RepID=A0ABW2V340_9BACL|nr:DUF3900 domain-containing protein [Paenibacillus thermoaerophilus]TMV10456.1 DUF3900 domain-containing protein [Paenibacillus thermoaerophilus]